MVLLFPPNESAIRCVNFELRVGMCGARVANAKNTSAKLASEPDGKFVREHPRAYGTRYENNVHDENGPQN